MENYKLRVFYKNLLHKDGITGQIIIRKGNKGYIIDKIKSELDKSRKIIIELV